MAVALLALVISSRPALAEWMAHLYLGTGLTERAEVRLKTPLVAINTHHVLVGISFSF